MKELKKRFQLFREEHPSLGDVIIMSIVVENMNYPKTTIQRAFNELVSKEEYEQNEKSEIVQALFDYSNTHIE